MTTVSLYAVLEAEVRWKIQKVQFLVWLDAAGHGTTIIARRARGAPQGGQELQGKTTRDGKGEAQQETPSFAGEGEGRRTY